MNENFSEITEYLITYLSFSILFSIFSRPLNEILLLVIVQWWINNNEKYNLCINGLVLDWIELRWTTTRVMIWLWLWLIEWYMICILSIFIQIVIIFYIFMLFNKMVPRVVFRLKIPRVVLRLKFDWNLLSTVRPSPLMSSQQNTHHRPIAFQ